MGDDDSSTKKYHQIVVPDHELKSGKSGTSFLRTGTFPSLTDPTKQPPGFQESHKLAKLAGEHHLKTGGSWHHVDGNRVETTTGRKVEVISGSYVAHRGPGNSPGPNFSATWATTSYTAIGSFDLPVGATPGSPVDSSSPAEPGENFVEGVSFGYSASFDRPANSSVDTTPATLTGVSGGDVITATWGRRLLTYQGSANQLANLVYAETQAGTIVTKSYAHSGNITTFIHGVGDTSCVWQDTLAKAITTSNEAIEITVTNTAANIFTNNLGTQEVLNLGPVMFTATAAPLVTTMTAAVAVETLTAAAVKSATYTVAPAILTVNVGAQTNVSVPEDNTIRNITNQINAIHAFLVDTIAQISTVADHISSDDTAMSMARLHIDTNYMVLNNLTLLGP